MLSTYTDYLNQWNSQYPNQVWLRERNGDADTDWSWHQAHTEINAIACWLESRFETTGHRIGLLSRNRAHWYFADLGACAAGHVVVPMFTTASSETADYVMNFTEMKVLFVGETENWDQVRRVLPEGILLIALPGVELAVEHLRAHLASHFYTDMLAILYNYEIIDTDILKYSVDHCEPVYDETGTPRADFFTK